LESAVAYYQEFIELRHDNPGAQADLESTRNRVQAILADLTLMRDAYRHLLLAKPAVEDDLKLTADERTKLAAVLGDIRELQPGPSPRRDPPPAAGEDRSRQMLREMRTHETAIAGILTPAQLTRLGQIALQVRGAEALQEPEVVTALDLSREQRSQLRSICGPHPGGRHHGPGPGRRHEAELQKALAILTPEQLTHWNEMTGRKFAGLGEPPHGRGHDGPHDDFREPNDPH
jgi:hypothetical protein